MEGDFVGGFVWQARGRGASNQDDGRILQLVCDYTTVCLLEFDSEIDLCKSGRETHFQCSSYLGTIRNVFGSESKDETLEEGSFEW